MNNEMKVSVGFTGTQRGMTGPQRESVVRLLGSLKPGAVHHGDCVGADTTFHDLCNRQGIPIIIHPPLQGRKRAMCNGRNVTILAPKAFLARNRDIVDASDVLIAAPFEEKEVLRSGTWATVRYAEQARRPVYLVLPSGRVMHSNYGCPL